ncbi:MAG: trpF [Bacteroidetes bacterium]|nr:trpF [Bacteroidota bacterium]
MRVKVKICGITNLEDAGAAVDYGVDALGFIFAEASPRFVTPSMAGEIIRELPPFVTPVGVFVNHRREEVLRMVKESGVRALQFHGEESPEDIAGYLLPVYKAFRISDGFQPSTLSAYPTNAYLLDTLVNGRYAWTGKPFNWEIAAEAARYGRIILSGGLTPENVREAVRVARPYAVDVSSGVEVSPGKKDSRKIRQLFAALKTI